MAATVYQLNAREAKARTVADWLRANRPDVDARVAERMSRFQRQAVTELAGLKADPPHRWKNVSPETWERVVSRLRHPARILPPPPDDPFDGLPS